MPGMFLYALDRTFRCGSLPAVLLIGCPVLLIGRQAGSRSQTSLLQLYSGVECMAGRQQEAGLVASTPQTAAAAAAAAAAAIAAAFY